MAHAADPVGKLKNRKICAKVSSNSGFPRLRTNFNQTLHKILYANPHFFGFAAHAQGEGLHLGWQWFESDRAPNSEILGFEAEFAQIRC